jgi:hypothetical protein
MANRPTECEFCGKAIHFGICDEMRAEMDRLRRERKPIPNPRVRN